MQFIPISESVVPQINSRGAKAHYYIQRERDSKRSNIHTRTDLTHTHTDHTHTHTHTSGTHTYRSHVQITHTQQEKVRYCGWMD